jgi:hypothetical protein
MMLLSFLEALYERDASVGDHWSDRVARFVEF